MLKLRVDVERITLNDVIALEEKTSLRIMRDIIARFVTDDSGAYLEHAAAIELVGSLPMSEVKEVAAQFAEAMKGAQNAALPPNGGGK
jgi:hypothetical protein